MSTIDPLPTPPSPSDSLSVFNARAFAFWAAIPTFQGQVNTVAGEINTNATNAAASAASAVAQAAAAATSAATSAANAAAAASSAGAAPWVSGTYAAGAPARSTLDYRIYVARTSGSKPTDPSLDPTNWGLAAPNWLQVVLVAGTTQTAAVGGLYVLTNAALSTLTAPPSPQQGDRFAAKVANGLTTNLINWNGAKHEGISDTTMTLDGPFMHREFVYINSTIGWITL